MVELAINYKGDYPMVYGRKIIGTVGVMSGVPYIPTEFLWSFQKMSIYNERFVTLPDEEILYIGATVSFHSVARNSLVERCEGEWLFMLDTDQQFDADVLGRLLYSLNEYNLDVISGVYYQKNPPYCPVVYRYSDELGGFQIISKFGFDDITKVDAVGGGCLLVRRKVFEKIESEMKEKPFDIRPPLGEDLSFFARCRELSIEVWCDPKVEVGHLKMKAIGKKDSESEMSGLEHDQYPTEIIQIA